MKKDNVTIVLPANWHATAETFPYDPVECEASRRLMRIRRLDTAVGALNAIATHLPMAYGWRFRTAESFFRVFRAKADSGASVGELNRLYWRDTLATIEAYTVMAVWRMVDISQSAFRCMEDEAIVPCAILARSAFESATQFVHDARTISASLENVIKQDLSSGIAVSTELEEYLLQTVFASRRTGTEDIYKSKNILTVLDKIAKIAKDEPIREEYEILCEVTHPNFLGRSTYLIGAEHDRNDGSELRFISPENGPHTEALTQSALWALSWAIEAQATSTHLVQGAVRDLSAALPPEASKRH